MRHRNPQTLLPFFLATMQHANRDVGGWRKKINIAKTSFKKQPPPTKIIWKKMRLLQAIPSKSERADSTQQACKNCDARATLSSPSPPSSLPTFRSSFCRTQRTTHAANLQTLILVPIDSPSELPFLPSVLFVWFFSSICYHFHLGFFLKENLYRTTFTKFGVR
jgi:hypothetical protein